MAGILVVEDEGEFRELLIEFLEELDHDVRGVGTSAEAVEVLDAWTPDIAILDWSLPDATGAQMVETVAGRAPDCVIIVSTGHGQNVTDAVRGRVRRVLQKPFKLIELAREVAAHT